METSFFLISYFGSFHSLFYTTFKAAVSKKNAGRRHLFIVDIPKPKTYSEKMKGKIDTPAGRDIYSKSMGIVEPVFANITVHKGLSRFTLRTKQKVNIQWLLYCMVHNMGKIAMKVFIFIKYFSSLLIFSRYYVIIKKCFSEYCI